MQLAVQRFRGDLALLDRLHLALQRIDLRPGGRVRDRLIDVQGGDVVILGGQGEVGTAHSATVYFRRPVCSVHVARRRADALMMARPLACAASVSLGRSTTTESSTDTGLPSPNMSRADPSPAWCTGGVAVALIPTASRMVTHGRVPSGVDIPTPISDASSEPGPPSGGRMP